MIPKYAFLPLLFLFLAVQFLPAQVTPLDIDPNAGCSYDGSEPTLDAIYAFDPSSQAVEVIDEIMDLMGLPSNFIIQSANVPNAMAQVIGGQRYVLYDEAFMAEIHNKTGDYWAQVAILAHELAHHLSGHTLTPGSGRPEIELEADQFSGFVLYKLGATLEQAQSAVRALPNNLNSKTHPPKSARLTAVTVGYKRAQEKEAAENASMPAGEAEDNPLSGKPLGTRIYPTTVLNGLTWTARNIDYETEGSWCYGNELVNCRQFGRLYTWDAAQRACTEIGMRLPTDAEWQALFRDGYFDEATLSDKGDPRKTYQTFVTEDGTPGNREFSVQLAGRRDLQGAFHDLRRSGSFWSTRVGRNTTWAFEFTKPYGKAYRVLSRLGIARSVRCVTE